MESEKRYFRMDRRQIGLLRFILEAYEGIAALTTIDAAQGRVVLMVPPGCEAEVDTLLADVSGEIYLEPDNEAME
ncbi:MAG: DUF4911 domain-containing protein [Desulfobacterales bacterium]|nr:DUF4911 domain-containing protein [Desulfobacterales bacterium]